MRGARVVLKAIKGHHSFTLVDRLGMLQPGGEWHLVQMVNDWP